MGYGDEHLAGFQQRLEELQQRYTFGEAAMRLALEQAEHAAAEDEVPVGAIIMAGRRVIAAAHNAPIGLRDPTAHAEILAIRDAAAHLGEYRLDDTSIFVTLEPCVMCIGAILHARIAQVYYGARDEKAGALGSVYDIGRDGRLNHHVEVYGGILSAECARLLAGFFESRRH
jgi:tRNA(Arg) A34 adenosine deaminase TadA